MDPEDDLSAQELEALLRSGERQEELRRHFGPGTYAELRHMAAAAPRSPSRGGTVFILPGLMGSKLKVHRNADSWRVWLRPLTIADGGLQDIRWQLEGTRVEAYDAFLFAYVE